MKRAKKSSKKRHKDCLDIEQNVPLIDRLSYLPDEVICHILSFLPTKFSAKTSILCKRWRYLWAHVPNLDFDFDRPRSWRSSFSSIVNRVVSLHRVQSLIFSGSLARIVTLTGGDGSSGHEFETCIAIAIERNVQSLDLFLPVKLPRTFLTCKTLVGLRIPSSGAISLPSLKKLHLDNIEYDLDLPRLLSGCPVLEELVIEGNPFDNSGCCNISSPTIIKLTIDFPCDSYVFGDPDYRVKINAPALRYLQVWDCSYERISVSSTTSLIEADISFYNLPIDL